MLLPVVAAAMTLAVKAYGGEAVRPFAPGEVRLLPSRFHDNFERD